MVYEWATDPDAVVPAPMPGWLIDLLKTPASTTTASIADASQTDRIQEGQRNDALFRLACSLRTKTLSEVAIVAALLALNAERCDPPLAEQEVRDIARSAARYSVSANSANSANQGNDPDSWDPPTPFHEFNLPPFPIEALPDPLRTFVEAEAEATQTQTDLAGMLTLSVCAASCATKVVVQVDEGWTEPLNIYTATLQESGTRKSAVFRDSVAPLEKHEADECRRLGPEVNAAQTRYNIAKNTLEIAEREAAKAPADEKELLSQEAEQLARSLAEMQVPVLPRYLADDSTPESLSKLLHEQKGRLALMSPEGGVFGIMGGRYSPNGTPNIDVYLKAHSGDTLRVDRVGRGAEHVETPALTLGLAIQPQVLQGLIDRATFRGRGLLARFLYSLPVNLVGRRKTRQPAVRFDVRCGYHDIVVKLLGLPWNLNPDEERIPHLLLLDPDARSQLQAFEEWLEPQLGEGGDLASIADWGSKLAGAVMRLAGILHMVDNLSAAEPWSIPISPSTVENAIKLGKYLIPHSKAAHALMGADAVVEDAKRLIRWITRSGRPEFTKRDVFEGTKGHFKKVAELEPALALLSDHGYVRERRAVDRPGPGRKPAPIYDVNPHLHSQNSHNSHNSESGPNSANTANCASPSQAPTSIPGAPIPDEGTSPDVDPGEGGQ
jgi:hypothetical protein